MEGSPGVPMLPVLLSEFGALGRRLGLLVVGLALAAACLGLRAAEPRIVALHGFEEVEVRQQGFTLPRAMKVHIYARGAGVRHLGRSFNTNPFFAYGWILNATTREVVWQMDGMNTKRNWEYRIADQYLDLPAGSYEAYFSNHGFAQSLLFAQWDRNIDRRDLKEQSEKRSHGFLAAIGAGESSLLRHWKEQVGMYGMELYLPSGDPKEVGPFEAPLRWQGIVLSVAATRDDGEWSQAFHLQRPVQLHIYALGEGSERRLNDLGWIQDVHTRARVWEMTPQKAQYAGGAQKNRRQVETIELPAGDYVATFVTDDSHSPADWNAAPPCDPGLYGLTLSLPRVGDASAFSLRPLPSPGPVLAELVKVGNSEDRSAPFKLGSAQTVWVYALGEANGDEMADMAWIEDAAGKRVWELDEKKTHHAGGARKNRVADELVKLGPGAYTLHVRTDSSHAYGHWNDDAPRDAAHYGATVYAVK